MRSSRTLLIRLRTYYDREIENYSYRRPRCVPHQRGYNPGDALSVADGGRRSRHVPPAGRIVSQRGDPGRKGFHRHLPCVADDFQPRRPPPGCARYRAGYPP